MKKQMTLLVIFVMICMCVSVTAQKIDRRAVVSRHPVVTTGTLLRSPAQVGNGKFAFGVDITGLQTFVPFNTMSDWSWHSFPAPEGFDPSDYKPVVIETYGKKVAYEQFNADQPEISSWLTKNPHRFNLGRIGFRILKENGELAGESDIKNARQEVDLWSGIIYSRFEINKRLVEVRTVCDPENDMIGVTVDSELLRDGNLDVVVDFSYPDDRYFRDYLGRYDTTQAHQSVCKQLAPDKAVLFRKIDATQYVALVNWFGDASFTRESEDNHRFILHPQNTNKLAFTCRFSPEADSAVSYTTAEIEKRSSRSWENYWLSGAAIDLSGSKDPRWVELERRIVLSQYLLRVNESGLFPPQESGLVNNGWYGRFHFEMIWWHGVHYGLWNRMSCFDSYLDVYTKFMPEALKRAEREGRKGARWPKCTADFNREWPCSAHAFLVWHEPHPIYFAELDYRINPSKETLKKWKDVVFSTADYMADYLFYDKKAKKYVMGSPVVIVSENTDPMQTVNPIFELAYWRYGLRTALEWGERLGLSEKETKKWKSILNQLPELPTQDGVYVTYEGIPEMWTKYTYEHPALTGIYGMLPGDGVDKEVFKRTLDKVTKEWQFDRIWGWDFPMLAMAAARTNRPDLAVDMLMHPSYGFQFDEHGLATGGPFPYFPSNGALLTAVAMMCGGWDGSSGDAPGFPKDGSWNVKQEGFIPMQ